MYGADDSSQSSDTRSNLGTIPRDGSLDATLALFRDGYDFIPRRCERLGSDIFRTRLLLRDVICMRGTEAARLFYGQAGLTRKGGIPQTVLRLLQDTGSVQQLDDGAHMHRKALFIRMLMQNDGIASLLSTFQAAWYEQIDRWSRMEQVVLFDEVNLILTRAVCRWTGVPLPETDLAATSSALAGMVENAGHVRPATLAALVRRGDMERHLQTVLQEVRSGHLARSKDCPVMMIADHLDFDGTPLKLSIAAVELLNILRPVVAVGRFITFAALYLHQHPQWRALFRSGDLSLLEAFAEETRRITPFFPFVGAVATKEIAWEGHSFSRGQWMLLDLYGTTHDDRLFPEPERFSPERQLSWRDQDYRFIPQGAGQTATTHRCPGEQVTLELIKEAVRLLCRDMDYDVPEQDFTVRRDRMPALPESGFVIGNVRRVAT